jgi:hypothetical protein
MNDSTMVIYNYLTVTRARAYADWEAAQTALARAARTQWRSDPTYQEAEAIQRAALARYHRYDTSWREHPQSRAAE